MYDPTKSLEPEGPPVTPQQLADLLHGRPNACRAPIDAALKTGQLPAVRIGRRWYIPRPIAFELLTHGRLPQAVAAP